MSTVTDIADAVVTMLNDASELGQDFTAVRWYQVPRDRKDLAELQVSVVPATWKGSPHSRSTSDNEYAIDIGIQKAFTSATAADINAELDPLMTFVEAIVDLFHMEAIGETGSRCMDFENDPIYDPDAFLERFEFLSVVRLICKKVR